MKRLLFVILGVLTLSVSVHAKEEVAADTTGQLVPSAPKTYTVDNYEQLVNGGSNMTLTQPENIQTSVEYDPVSGCYVLHTRVA